MDSIEDPSNMGDVGDDPLETTARVSAKVAEMVEGRPAKACVMLAMTLSEGGIECDPADRYHFEHHVPVLADLSDDERYLHDSLMAELIRVIEAWEFQE